MRLLAAISGVGREETQEAQAIFSNRKAVKNGKTEFNLCGLRYLLFQPSRPTRANGGNAAKPGYSCALVSIRGCYRIDGLGCGQA
jgi:hypothetical protein